MYFTFVENNQSTYFSFILIRDNQDTLKISQVFKIRENIQG